MTKNIVIRLIMKDSNHRKSDLFIELNFLNLKDDKVILVRNIVDMIKDTLVRKSEYHIADIVFRYGADGVDYGKNP